MNRRSFIAGILAACVAPAILVPKLKDRSRWRVRRHRGFYIMEFQYAVKPYNEADLKEVEFFVRSDAAVTQEYSDLMEEGWAANPDYAKASHDVEVGPIDFGQEYAGKWRFIEWKGPPSEVLAS